MESDRFISNEFRHIAAALEATLINFGADELSGIQGLSFFREHFHIGTQPHNIEHLPEMRSGMDDV